MHAHEQPDLQAWELNMKKGAVWVNLYAILLCSLAAHPSLPAPGKATQPRTSFSRFSRSMRSASSSSARRFSSS